MRVRWTPAAFDDLRTISDRIESERSLKAANRICRLIYDAVQMLRRFPESGKIGIQQGTRELVVAQTPYIVVYRKIHLNVVEILAIWHGAQNRLA